jgi:hypothetical protein
MAALRDLEYTVACPARSIKIEAVHTSVLVAPFVLHAPLLRSPPAQAENLL